MVNKNFLITDISGFIGFHLKVHLKYKLPFINNIDRISLRDIDQNSIKHSNYDTVFFTSFKNRGGDLIDENLKIVENFINLIESRKITISNIVFLNSTQILSDNVTEYIEAKIKTSKLLEIFSRKKNINFHNLLLPNIFGEFSKPQTNSFISTCSYNVLNDIKFDFLNNHKIKYYYVSDIVELILDPVNFKFNLSKLPYLFLSANEIYEILLNFQKQYFEENLIPHFKNTLFLKLFNTMRSLVPYNKLLRSGSSFTDDRGTLVENYNFNGKASNFISTTEPGYERGNHFHMIKLERFRFYGAEFKVILRKLFEPDCHEYIFNVNDFNNFIDIPTYHTHKLINTSSKKGFGIFMSIPRYNKNNPDTFTEIV